MSFSYNCPYFKIGECKGFNDQSCIYKYHKKCNDNFRCDNYECTFGHGISPVKRAIISEIYDTNFRSNGYGYSETDCQYTMTCFKKNCQDVHDIELSYRSFIANLVKKHVNDNMAHMMYNEFNSQYDDVASEKSTTIHMDIHNEPLSDTFVVQNNEPLSDTFVVQNNESLSDTFVVQNNENTVELIKIEKIEELMQQQLKYSNHLLQIANIKHQINTKQIELAAFHEKATLVKTQIVSIIKELAATI